MISCVIGFGGGTAGAWACVLKREVREQELQLLQAIYIKRLETSACIV